MKIKLSIAAVAAILFLSFTATKAQSGPPTASALKAAEEMLIASGGKEQFDKNIVAGVEQMSAQIPEDKRAKFVEVMKVFLTKYCSWEALKNDLFVMYAREFTEAELKQLTAFYKSPVGVKMSQKQPLILQTSMALGQKAAADHQAELQQMMGDVIK
jgi:hypothetical protein